MKKLLILLVIFISFNSYSQNFNGYKYVYVPELGGLEQYGLEDLFNKKAYYNIIPSTIKFFKLKGFQVVNSIEEVNNQCEVITVLVTPSVAPKWRGEVNFKVLDCEKEIYQFSGGDGYDVWKGTNYNMAVKNAFGNIPSNIFKDYVFDSSFTPDATGIQNSETIETDVRKYLDSNRLNPVEGIWIFQENITGPYLKASVVKNSSSNLYEEKIIEFLNEDVKKLYQRNGFRVGDIVATGEPMGTDKIFLIRQKGYDSSYRCILENSRLLNCSSNGEEFFAIKSYPINDNLSPKQDGSNEWSGNGSGLIISESGYIVTNNHVIEDANQIEVEFILNDEIQNFNAEIVQVDKVNDLAIIKIFDMNFDGVDDLPYNFKSRSSDVGTTVYAYGYPMALSVMGKEIKVTDGIINSKSGFQGDITTYQISAPIQGGNSGGPLFDNKGNFIGINSAVIRKDIADNVGYTIKSSYVLNLIDVLPKSIDLPSSSKLEALPLTEQIKEISKYVVLIKIKN